MSTYLDKAKIEFKCFGNLYDIREEKRFIENRLLKFEELKNKGEPIFLEIEDSFLVGFKLYEKSVFFVFGLYISSNYKLRVLGKLLFDLLEKNEVHYLTAIVNKKNLDSNSLMKKLGFEIDLSKEKYSRATFFYKISSKKMISLLTRLV